MKPTELAEQIDIEFEAVQLTIDEIASLRKDVSGREPTVRELAAAGLFLANFYNGIENVLKRVCRFHEIDIPAGSDWHVELVKAFCDPPRGSLPILLDHRLANDLAPFRQFRHLVHHGYGFRLRWPDMLPGVEGASDVFARFKATVESHLHEVQS